MSSNPYSSPKSVSIEVTVPVVRPGHARPFRALGRWTLICCISAAPSFFWGCAIHQGIQSVLAMLAGILVFVLGYTLVECTHYYQQIVTRPHVHRTVLVGYASRILVSVIFPVGLAIDMVIGAASVSIVENISPLNSHQVTEVGSAATGFNVFLTTVVQGALLNLALFGYMLGVYGLLVVIAKVRERARQQTHEVAIETS